MRGNGTNIHQGVQGLETVHLKGMDLTLLAAGDGTEIIHHRLQAGARWAVTPSEGWSALEFVYVLKGTLVYKSDAGDVHLQAGDRFSAYPVDTHCSFYSETATEFLYVTSQPVFNFYSKVTNEVRDLAVSIENKDGYTADHCHKIMKLSMAMGERLGLSSYDLHVLNLGAFLHDIGKVRIPEEILNKPAKLTDFEWEVMKKHTLYGREILEETGDPYLRAASRIVEQHHERFDGLGYPYGLKGDAIQLSSAIVSVADSYDAIISNRVYKTGQPKDEALGEIERCRGSRYHPDIVDVFLEIVHAF